MAETRRKFDRDFREGGVRPLLRVYAKCISGQQSEAKRRIEEATRPRDDE